jgi:class 3 adenylate cyclase/tetratricopeptide (TPR) repeat protein
MEDQPGIACPACGTLNPAGFHFCGRCGAALLQVCLNCGVASPPGFRFCGGCGSALHDAQLEPRHVEVEERKVVSVVFADLEASTEIATRLDPEDLRDVYGPYFAEMAAQIERFGGAVEKFIGDAVVGIFGAPVAHDDDPVRAVRAGLAMQERMKALNVRVAAKLGGELALRVGVHTGEVLATPAAEHESVVTGEATTLASRLQGLAPSGGVVVSSRTHRVTAQLFEYQALGDFELKGVTGQVPVWRALIEKHARPLSADTPFVGRRDELELLGLLLRRCVREGRPYVVTLIAPPGMGKTRLVAEFASSGARAGTGAVVRGRCLPYGDGLRFWPLAEIVKEDAGILDSDPPAVILDKARASIGIRFDDAEERLAITSTLLSSLGVAVEADPLTGAGRQAVEKLISRAWARYFESRADAGALTAIIEDIHWADAGVLDLLERLAGAIVGPVLIVCLARPDIHERRPNWGAGRSNFATIELSPLSRAEERLLIDSLLDEAPVDEELATLISDRAEGNPFFATELLRMLRDDGAIELRTKRWATVREVPSNLPDTVQAVIAARLDRLAAPAKRAIQDAAVVGRVFWNGALERLGGGNPSAPIDELVERGLVHAQSSSSIAGAAEFVFDHALVRDVAYASIPRARRREAHAAALGWMETVTRGRDEEFAELLAHHAIAAGDAEQTARYAAIAGDRYRRVYSAADAIRWYDRALEPAAQLGANTSRLLVPEILHGRAEAYEQLGELERAAADYERELAIARTSERPWLEAHALAALTHVLWLADDYARAETLLPAALKAARASETADPALEARLLFTAGSVAWSQGEWARALGLHRQALAIATRERDLEGEAFARQGLADTLSFSGPLAGALEEGLRATELWRRLGQRPREYRSAQRLDFIYLLLGRFAEGLTSIEATLRGLHELGQRRDEGLTLSAQGLALLFAGELSRARVALDEAVNSSREQSAPRAELTARVSRALYASELGADPNLWQDIPAATALSRRLGGYLGPPISAAEAAQRAIGGDHRAAADGFRLARAAAEGTIFYELLCGRIEISAWELAADAGQLRDAADWLAQRAAGESPPHVVLAACSSAAADVIDLDKAHPLATDLLSQAIEVGDVTVIWRAMSLGPVAEGVRVQTFADAAASLEDEELRRAFTALRVEPKAVRRRRSSALR